MLEQNLNTNSCKYNLQTMTFEELWETDIDSLYEEYGLNSDLDDEELYEENWLLF